MVFMSLLLSTELSILFNSAPVTTHVREALREGRHHTISFWAGFMIITSAILTILSLIALFTAWGMVNSIDEINTHCIFRSSIGQYAAELPGRLIVCSIYSFLISFMMFFFLLLPVGSWSVTLSGLTAFLFFHIVSTFSAFGRIIMHTGAMSNARIFTPEFEDFLLPHTLHANLLMKAQANLANKASIIRQYRRKQQPIDRHLSAETMYEHLSSNTMEPEIPHNMAYRQRADSTVRFADVEQGKNTNNNSYNNNRNLTPLSDASSYRGNNQSLLLSERPTPTYSSLRKTYVGGQRSPRLGKLPVDQTPKLPTGFGVMTSLSNTVENVSTSSLEQWLQRATPQSELSNAASVPHSSDDHESSDPIRISTHATLKAKPCNSPKEYEQDTIDYSISSPLQYTTRLTPDGSALSFANRSMSEDERFAMDYGEFDDEDTKDAPIHVDEMTTNGPSRPNRVAYSAQYSDDKRLENGSNEERQLLLSNSDSRHLENMSFSRDGGVSPRKSLFSSILPSHDA